MNTFWLIAAGLIVIIAVALVFVILPRLRNTRSNSLPGILVGGKASAIVAVTAICLFAVALYFAWSKPVTNTPPGPEQIAKNGQMAPEHIEMIKGLQDRLEKNPNDGKGWGMLGRSYAVLGRFNESAAAYEKATNLIPDNAVLLVNYADVLAMVNGKSLQGKPLELLHSALKIDPNNTKALLLSGKAAYQIGDYAHAVAYFEKLLQLLPPNSPQAKQIQNNIAQVRAQQANPQPPTKGDVRPATSVVHISGMVSLSPSLATKAAPTDTVFVFAKALSGPPMPIAVMRSKVKDLPLKFVLDDTMAMTPSMKLSNFKMVAVSAKISKSGNATPQSGDLRGEIASVKVGADNVQLVIDKVAP